jgi:hypothetical protein
MFTESVPKGKMEFARASTVLLRINRAILPSIPPIPTRRI